MWACPVCSAKILARRSLEIGAGLLTWEGRGGRLVMGTLTMRHHRGHSLAAEFDALLRAWGSVNCSKVWKRWLVRLGSPGLVRVTEVTFGWDNGWHVHLHFVLLVGGEVQAADVESFTAWLVPKWARALEVAGMPGALEQGQDVHLIDGVAAAVELGDYLAKSTAYGAADSLGRELMGVWSKSARGGYGTEPAWRLAEDFGATGDKELLDLWREYERGSKGRRQMAWSGGLRELLALGSESTDEQLAAEAEGDSDLLLLSGDGWASVLAQPWPASRLLDVLEEGGMPALRALLDEHGIGYLVTEAGREVD